MKLFRKQGERYEKTTAVIAWAEQLSSKLYLPTMLCQVETATDLGDLDDCAYTYAKITPLSISFL